MNKYIIVNKPEDWKLTLDNIAIISAQTYLTHPDFARANDGKLYILAIIDTFTKWVYMTRLKDKTAKTKTNGREAAMRTN